MFGPHLRLETALAVAGYARLDRAEVALPFFPAWAVAAVAAAASRRLVFALTERGAPFGMPGPFSPGLG